MTNTFELQPTDYAVTFAYYIKGEDILLDGKKVGSDYDFGPEQMIIITDCYTESQATDKFWELCGQDHEGVCMFDCYQAEETPERYVSRLEKEAIVEHLFGTTQFGQTDLAKELKYSDHE